MLHPKAIFMEVEQNMLKKKDKDLNGDEISISPTKQQNNGVNNSCTKTHTWSTFAEELEDSKMRFIHSYKFLHVTIVCTARRYD